MLNPTSVDNICPNPLTYFLTSNFGGTHTDGVCSCVLGSPALGLMEISLRVRHVRCRHLAKKNITPTHQGLVLCVLGSTKWDWGVLHGSSPSDLSKVATIRTNFNHAKCWSFSKNIQSEFAWFSIRHWQKKHDVLGKRPLWCPGIDPSAWVDGHWKPPDDIRWHRTPFGKSKNSSMTSHDHPFNIFQHLSTSFNIFQHLSTSFNTFQHLSTPFNTFQHLSTPFNTFQHLSTSFNTFQHLSTSFNIFQHLSTSFNIFQPQAVDGCLALNWTGHGRENGSRENGSGSGSKRALLLSALQLHHPLHRSASMAKALGAAVEEMTRWAATCGD